MLELKFIRSNLELIDKMLKNRGYDLDISVFETLDRHRREKLAFLESLRHQRNKVSEDIASMKKRGEDASNIIEEMKHVSSEIRQKEAELSGTQNELDHLLMIIPNVPHPSVPIGKDDNDNALIRIWGEKRPMDFKPLEHWEIGERLGILDFARAAKIAGARFALFKGHGSRLERALLWQTGKIYNKHG